MRTDAVKTLRGGDQKNHFERTLETKGNDSEIEGISANGLLLVRTYAGGTVGG